MSDLIPFLIFILAFVCGYVVGKFSAQRQYQRDRLSKALRDAVRTDADNFRKSQGQITEQLRKAAQRSLRRV